jgi:hypothetical protein
MALATTTTLLEETRGDWTLTVMRQPDCNLRGSAVRVDGWVTQKLGGVYSPSEITPEGLMRMIRAWLRIKERRTA